VGHAFVSTWKKEHMKSGTFFQLISALVMSSAFSSHWWTDTLISLTVKATITLNFFNPPLLSLNHLIWLHYSMPTPGVPNYFSSKILQISSTAQIHPYISGNLVKVC
jgi:hypothetical protein